MAAALLCVAFFLWLPPATGQSNPTWVQIFDQQAVSFSQLDPTTPDTIAPDWNQGVITMNYQQLLMDGFSGGYLQVLEFNPSEPTAEDGAWILQNIPIMDPSFIGGDSAVFTFAVHNSGPVGTFPVGVYAVVKPPAPAPARGTNQPKQPMLPPAPKAPPPRVFVPANPKQVTIGQGMPALATPPVTYRPDQILPVDATQADTKNAPLTNQNPVAELPSQCAPGSVANSLTYLGVNDGNTNAPSGQPNSRVAGVDAAMGRQAGKGTPTLNIIQGKLMYINQKGLKLVVHHQGRFCPTNNINDQKCQQGTIDDGGNPPGAVTSTPGAGGGVGNNGTLMPKAAFLTGELDNKEDVEICFRWAGPPPGAHCVQTTGYNWESGYLRLTIIQDPNQGPTNTVPGGRMVDAAKVPLARMPVHVGLGPDGNLWIQDWPAGPAQITNIISESPPGG